MKNRSFELHPPVTSRTGFPVKDLFSVAFVVCRHVIRNH